VAVIGIGRAAWVNQEFHVGQHDNDKASLSHVATAGAHRFFSLNVTKK
jgi:hypothetical protein